MAMDKNIQELIKMRHSLKAIRDQVNEALDEMDSRLASMVPAEAETRHQRLKNTDWKKEIASW